MAKTLFTTLLSLALTAGTAFAQVVNTQQTITQPRRDVPQPPAQTGTAIIRGRIVAADTGRPLRRARVTVSAPELGREPKTTSTGLDGRYEIKDLPAGRYTLSVMRSGYLRLQYGQRRPLEQGQPMQIADRQVIDHVDFSLPRMGIISGRVVDETSDPVSEVTVLAMRSTFFEGRRRLTLASSTRTDDAGQFRILGLAPGAYYLEALMRDTWTVTINGTEETQGYAMTFFPGTPSATDAKRIVVGVGQEVGNADFALIPGRAARVSGTAFDSQGKPLAGQRVGVNMEFRGREGAMFLSNAGGTVNPDGTFTIKDVTPGEYRLVVGGNGPGEKAERVAMPLTVTGTDIDNIVLTSSVGWSASGTITTENGTAPTLARDRVRLRGQPLQPDNDPRAISGRNGEVNADWSFAVQNLYGPNVLRVTLPDGWTVKAIVANGRDIADAPVEMKSGEELAGLQVIVTDKVSTVAGGIVDDKNAPVTDGTAILFSIDPEKWLESSRFVRSARPDQQGQFQVKGLPAGEYLAVAIDYVQDGLWNDPEFLESIRRYGQRLSLGDTDTKSVVLKLVLSQP